MTWVVGGNCFNGFICVADIQITIEYPHTKEKKYFNCVQKIHKAYDNLCIAFSGDVKSGLLIIEDLSRNLQENIKENEYFDIDGQSKRLINYLKIRYKEINPNSNPSLELMFLWNAQEGEEISYRPFCYKFMSPDFKLHSTPQINLSQSGSGKNNDEYQAIVSFLSGKHGSSEAYKNLFSQIPDAPQIWTVQKFKKFLFQEASNINFPGVSKTLISFESEIQYKNAYPNWMHQLIKSAFIKSGIEYSTITTNRDTLNLAEFDINNVINKISSLKETSPDEYREISMILSLANETMDLSKIYTLPKIVSDMHFSESEEIDNQPLISSWDSMVRFLKSKNIRIGACSAISA